MNLKWQVYDAEEELVFTDKPLSIKIETRKKTRNEVAALQVSEPCYGKGNIRRLEGETQMWNVYLRSVIQWVLLQVTN